MVLDCKVNDVTGFVQFVTSVFGVLPDVVTLTLALPELVRVSVFEPPELATRLVTITGTGNVIVPIGPLLVI